MARRLTDGEVERIRDLAAEGSTNAEIADRFGISPQYVGQLVRGEKRPARPQIAGLDAKLVAEGSVSAALEHYLGQIEIDEGGAVLAAVARRLAQRLDVSPHDAATPAVAKQLVSVLYEIRAETTEPDAVDELRARREARHLLMLGTDRAN